MPFRGEEAEKNRYHELRISEIFARAAQPTFPPSLDFSHFLNGHTFTVKVSYIPNQTTKPISPDNHDPYQPYFLFKVILSLTATRYVLELRQS